MNGRERLMAHLNGQPADRLAVMPITMMFAGDQIGAKYREYATDYRVMTEAQLRTAERFEWDYVSSISDPTREAADFGAAVRYFPDEPPSIDEGHALLAEEGRQPGAHFGYSGPLTEICLLGNIAKRVDARIEWDAASMQVTNLPEANNFVRAAYRPG
jgi:hypothetical protein